MEVKANRAPIVAVFDTGVDYNHSAISTKVYKTSLSSTGNDFIDSDLDAYDEGTLNGKFHGTMVAGVIALNFPEVQIYPVRILHSEGIIPIKKFKDAVKHVHSLGIRVINLSWSAINISYWDIHEHIEVIKSYPDIIFVVGSGNFSLNLKGYDHFPAKSNGANVLIVGALDEELTHIARWRDGGGSNYGKDEVDFFAPGTNIKTILPNDKFTYVNGTSYAAPFTAGLLARFVNKKSKVQTTKIIENFKRLYTRKLNNLRIISSNAIR